MDRRPLQQLHSLPCHPACGFRPPPRPLPPPPSVPPTPSSPRPTTVVGATDRTAFAVSPSTQQVCHSRFSCACVWSVHVQWQHWAVRGQPHTARCVCAPPCCSCQSVSQGFICETTNKRANTCGPTIEECSSRSSTTWCLGLVWSACACRVPCLPKLVLF